MFMDLFLEIFTIVFSFLISFFLAKILSASSSSNSTCSDDVVYDELEVEAKSKTNGSECERRYAFVEKLMEVGDLGESRRDKFVVEEILNDTCGSCDDIRIDENQVLTEVEQGLVVETADKSDGVCECEKSEKISRFEIDLTKDEVLEEIDLTKDEVLEGERIAKFEMDLTKDGILEREKIATFEKDLTKNEFLESENKHEENDSKAKGCVFECEEILVDTMGEIEKINEIETPFNEHGMVVAKTEDIENLKGNSENESKEANQSGEDGVKEVCFDEDDDWEGIERTELERLFGVAVAFVGNKSNADGISCLGSDVKTQLYGLHKIATEGPCHEPQPMALKVSARANWNAWKQLGNMAPEVAMEQYVTILLKNIPGCIEDNISGDSKQIFSDADACNKLASDLKTWKRDQLGAVDKR